MSITGVVTIDVDAPDARAWLWEIAEQLPFGEPVELVVGDSPAPDPDFPVEDPWRWLVAEHPLTVKGSRHVAAWVAFLCALEAQG